MGFETSKVDVPIRIRCFHFHFHFFFECSTLRMSNADDLTFPDAGKVICPGDGTEAFPAVGWITAGCSVPSKQISFDAILANLKEIYPRLLSVCPQLRMKMCMIHNHLHWVFADNKEICFSDMVRVVEPPKDTVPKTFPLDDHPVWRLELYKTGSGDELKTHILFYVSHALADGTSTFMLLDLFLHIAVDKVIPQKFIEAGRGPLTTSFKKRDLFTNKFPEKIPPPATWDNIVEFKLYPPVSLPSHVVNTQWSTDYSCFSAFCLKHKVSLQAILMAMISQAVRRFHKGAIDDLPLIAYIAVNTRRSPSAIPSHSSSAFYPGVGLVLPRIVKQPTLLEDIIHCKDMLHSVLKSDEAVSVYNLQAEIVNPVDFTFNFPANFPITYNFNLVAPSNLGLVCAGYDDVVFRSYSPVDSNGYWPNIYTFHNGKTLYFMFVHPYNIDKEFLTAVNQSYQDVLELVQKDTKE